MEKDGGDFFFFLKGKKFFLEIPSERDPSKNPKGSGRKKEKKKSGSDPKKKVLLGESEGKFPSLTELASSPREPGKGNGRKAEKKKKNRSFCTHPFIHIHLSLSPNPGLEVNGTRARRRAGVE